MKELKRFLPYLYHYRFKIIIGFVFVTISNISSTMIPRVVGTTIDTIKGGSFSMDQVISSLLMILGLTLASGLFMFLTRQTIIVVSRYIEYDLRRDFLYSIENQSMDFFNQHPTGSIMAHITNDISAAREFLGPAIMYGANTVTTFIFALYFMLNLNPTITFIALIPLPFIAYTTYKIGKKVHYAFKNVQDQFAKLTTQAQETFSGIRVVKSYVREDYESDRFSEYSKDYLFKNLKLARIQSLMMPVLMILVGSSQILILGYGGLQVINGNATLGDIAQFFIYINLLIWPIAAIGWVTNLVQRAAASAGRLSKILDREPTIKDGHLDNIGSDSKVREIKFENVSLKYSDDSPYILQNINLTIPENSSIGIIGKVGSGKTSLVNLIPRLYDPTTGTITINGIDIKEISIRTLRKLIGYVPQDSFLFSMTIAENIKFGKPDASIEEIIHFAKIANLHDDIMTFPEGYNTLLGERGITLSGGQKQRLAIARALIKNPEILILDDSLSAVDTQTESLILNELKKFMKDRISIIISHRVSTIKDLDNIIVLKDGKIVESGNHNQLLEFKGIYADLYHKQLLEEEIEML
ncbi:MAG: ABC transporter ATP-binding protein/permease [Candidatus Kapabacteria bacterium]|nr:ABC transporter ATP-binding protein/permease [Candidatus Kapabacteria bacterium]